MKLLIYGCGVIGSVYAVRFAGAGFDVSVYARGKRLEALQEKGLLYEEKGRIKKASVTVLSKVEDSDFFDFVFLPVQHMQAEEALKELSSNQSPTIVTMINSLGDYQKWEEIAGKGRILPAFAGAGGGLEADILKAGLTPAWVQRTTFGEISGKDTRRLRELEDIFRLSRVPYRIEKDMRAWQICHLAMVVPLAEVYYQTDNPEAVWKENDIMKKTAHRLRRNFIRLKKAKISITPLRFHLFYMIPEILMVGGLSLLYRLPFAKRFMQEHSLKAEAEIKTLRHRFCQFLVTKKAP